MKWYLCSQVLFTSTLQMLDSWTLWNLDEHWGTLNLDLFFGGSCLCTLQWHELCSYCFYHLFIMCWWMSSYKSHWLLRNFWCPYFNSQRSFWMSVWIGAGKANYWYACDGPVVEAAWGTFQNVATFSHIVHGSHSSCSSDNIHKSSTCKSAAKILGWTYQSCR